MTLMKYGAGDEPELDRPVVERTHADRVPSVLCPGEALALLEDEVDRDRRAGVGRVEDALDTELDVVCGERRPVGPLRPSRRWKT